jgi:transposase
MYIIKATYYLGFERTQNMVSNNKLEGKNKALRKQHALNPHPENVIDPLFEQLDFFDSRDLVQVKYEMLRRVWKEGWSVAQAARTFGFSRNAFYKAQEAFQTRGIAGLLRQRPGPRAAHKLTEQVMTFLEKTLSQETSLTTTKLQQMVEERFGVSVHRRSIERALKRRQKRGSRQSNKR